MKTKTKQIHKAYASHTHIAHTAFNTHTQTYINRTKHTCTKPFTKSYKTLNTCTNKAKQKHRTHIIHNSFNDHTQTMRKSCTNHTQKCTNNKTYQTTMHKQNLHTSYANPKTTHTKSGKKKRHTQIIHKSCAQKNRTKFKHKSYTKHNHTHMV